MVSKPDHPEGGAEQSLELPIEGITCAGCAAKIERKLNSLDGARATLNPLTETASIKYDPERAGPEDFAEAVRAAGYKPRLPAPAGDGQPGHGHGAGGDHEGGARHDDAGADHRHDHSGHDHNAHATVAPGEQRELGRRLAVAAVLTVPVLVMAMIRPLQFDYWQWISLVLATPVVFWSGIPFHRSALNEVRHRMPGMDTLVSMGTLAAYAWSVVALILLDAGMVGMKMDFSLIPERGGGTGEVYFEVAAVVTTFILAGRYMEARAKTRAGSALKALLSLGAKDATVIAADGSESKVPIERLQVGDLFRVRPGEKVATDGLVIEGESAIDRSLLTGESVPVEVAVGDTVAGATLNTSGSLTVRATRVGSDTALARIGRLVTEAQSGKAPVQRLADRISAVFVPAVIVLAIVTLAVWILAGDGVAFAFNAAVSVLIIACPCALGLATPTALMVGTGRGAQLGILIRGPEILEATRQIGAIVLDKTGTVTRGVMELERVVSDPRGGEDRVEQRREALTLAGAVEAASEHPIAEAIAAAAREASGDEGALPPVSGFVAEAGIGATGVVKGRKVRVGRIAALLDGADPPSWAAEAIEAAAGQGKSTVGVAWEGQLRAVFVIADQVKPGSAEAIRELRELGLEPVLLTGDAEPTARAVAAEVGITEVIAEVMPDQKVEVVERLQAEQERAVAMVGDGVNDAPALARSDLGLSIGSGSDVAIEASDLTLVGGNLRAAPAAIRLSRATLRTIKQNLFWAFAYNVAALPLAAAGYLSPIIAGAAMALSSLLVVTNSLRLRRFHP